MDVSPFTSLSVTLPDAGASRRSELALTAAAVSPQRIADSKLGSPPNRLTAHASSTAHTASMQTSQTSRATRLKRDEARVTSSNVAGGGAVVRELDGDSIRAVGGLETAARLAFASGSTRVTL